MQMSHGPYANQGRGCIRRVFPQEVFIQVCGFLYLFFFSFSFLALCVCDLLAATSSNHHFGLLSSYFKYFNNVFTEGEATEVMC